MKKKFSLKDHLFNKDKISYLAGRIKQVDESFADKSFEQDIMSRLPSLELKERINLITKMLHTYLPKDYEKAIDIMVKSLPEQLDPNKTDGDFGDFIFAPYTYYIAYYGCKEHYLDISYAALHQITRRFSAEDAIRCFLNKYETQTLNRLRKWSTDSNYHVRRLVSEGTRPKLPWSAKLNMDYHKALPLLDVLYKDNTRYVTRSVANHINDLSKIDASLSLSIINKWQQQQKQTKQEMDYISRHGLRTLIKAGNSRALELLGFSSNPNIAIKMFDIRTKTVKLGTQLIFELNLRSHHDQSLLIDYIIGFAKKDGKIKEKVFKLKTVSLGKNKTLKLTKKHAFRKNMSTFTIYPGTHTLALQINGTVSKRREFIVLD